MRKWSKNKCYPPSTNKKEVYEIDIYPKMDDKKFTMIQDMSIHDFDTFSNQTTVSAKYSYGGIKDDKDDSIVFTSDPIDMANMGLRMLQKSLTAMGNNTNIQTKYKYMYELMKLYTGGKIDTIYLYCTGLAAFNNNHPDYGRYVITVSGYDTTGEAEKCLIHFEVVTGTNYIMHPSRIINDILKDVTESGLSDVVKIDGDSFDTVIAELKRDNKMDMEKGLTDQDIKESFDALDKRLNIK